MVSLRVDMPAFYELKVHGQLGDDGQKRFQALSTRYQEPVTILQGVIADQAELLGILRQLVNLGLPLLEVRCTEYQSHQEEALP